MKSFVAKYYLRKTRDKVMENKIEIKQKRELPFEPVQKNLCIKNDYLQKNLSSHKVQPPTHELKYQFWY